jgi:thiol:disulfide interchange protein DsbC
MIQRFFVHVMAVALLSATVACADEASVKKAFQARFPKANVDSVTKLKNFDLYEIVIPRGDDPIIIYTDENFRFMLQGSLVDTGTMTDLTEQRRAKLTAIDFDSLPLDKAIKKIKGKGTRKLVVFSDPDCPFCKRVEQEFEKMDDITVYVMLYPIEQLHPKAAGRARSIWCSSNRLKAWDDYMLKNVAPTAAETCDNPVAELMEYGQKKGINATPTLVFADGVRVPGALTADQIEARFAEIRNSTK